MSYLINCPNKACGIRLKITEDPGSGPGGKERETANCPACSTEVASVMTNGFLYADRVEEGRDNPMARF